MEESFLHYVWKHGSFYMNSLVSTMGQPLGILDRGTYNTDAGPDFFNGKIRIGPITLTGNIEIHVYSSDWNKHGHNSDPAYQNTILHVVWKNDADIYLADGKLLPCLELIGKINPKLNEDYDRLSHSMDTIPCAGISQAMARSAKNDAMNQAIEVRLRKKSEGILQMLAGYKNDWQQVFYLLLARSLGNRVNDAQMEMLACYTPLNIVARMADDSFSIEAMLFGQAGFLTHEIPDNYHMQLRKTYAHLCRKYQLESMPVTGWKFMRMRPAGFPTLRIAFLSALLFEKSHRFGDILSAEKPEQLAELFRCEPSAYWNSHFRFGAPCSRTVNNLGLTARNGLLINAVSPVLYAYGISHSDESLMHRALQLLREIPPETNKITRQWESLGFENTTAYSSQALIGLQKHFCIPRKCLECAVGQKLLQTEDKLAIT